MSSYVKEEEIEKADWKMLLTFLHSKVKQKAETMMKPPVTI